MKHEKNIKGLALCNDTFFKIVIFYSVISHHILLTFCIHYSYMLYTIQTIVNKKYSTLHINV